MFLAPCSWQFSSFLWRQAAGSACSAFVLARTKSVPLWAATSIILSAMLFPVSRISGIELAAYISDGLVLAPLAYLGWQMYSKGVLAAGN